MSSTTHQPQVLVIACKARLAAPVSASSRDLLHEQQRIRGMNKCTSSKDSKEQIQSMRA